MIGWDVRDGIGVLTLAATLATRSPHGLDLCKQAIAAAFAVPDERLGEKVCLAGIPVEGRDIEPDALLEHLAAEGLSRFDMPEYFMAVDDLPMTASGKVLKRTLVEQAKNGEIELHGIRYRAPQAGN